MTKFEPCPGATSDHAWRSIAVNFIGVQPQDSFHLQGATWNMQVWCISQADAKKRAQPGWTVHGNNPMDISEDPDDYYARKRQQIIKLKAIMGDKNQFIFLQEPDWVNHPRLLTEYQAMLAQNGWGMVRSIQTKHDQTHQNLVTLYDTRKLVLDKTKTNEGLFKSKQTLLIKLRINQ